MVGGRRHAPAALPPGKRLVTYCTEGWLSLGAGLDGPGKISPRPRFKPRTVQLAVIRYTVYAMSATSLDFIRKDKIGIVKHSISKTCLSCYQFHAIQTVLNPLNPELNPICYLLALLGAHHFLHVSRIRVKSLTLRRLMSYIYGAPILDVSRSHTTTQHSR